MLEKWLCAQRPRSKKRVRQLYAIFTSTFPNLLLCFQSWTVSCMIKGCIIKGCFLHVQGLRCQVDLWQKDSFCCHYLPVSQGGESIIDRPAALFVNYIETIWQKTLMCPGEAAKEEGRMVLFSKQKYFHGGREKRKVSAEKNREP